MEREILSRINPQLLPQTQHCKLSFRLFNWIKFNIYFSKSVFFILGLVFSHSFVQNAMVSVLMDYLSDDLKQSLPKAAATVKLQEGVAVICALIIAHIADACIGRFKVLVYATASFVIGLMLWCLAHRFIESSTQVGLMCPVMVLVLMGMASGDPTLKAFLRDQLEEHKPNVNMDYDKAEARRKFWWTVASGLGTIASTVVSMFTDSENTIFVICTIVMGLAYIAFGLGISFYRREPPNGSPLLIVYGVLKAALLKCHLPDPHDPNDYHENNNGELVLSPDICVFRWLNRAALLESSSIPKEQVKKGRLCSVSDVKRVKLLFTMIPMWTTLLLYSLVLATESTFFVHQSDDLREDVPKNAFFLLRDLVKFITPYAYYVLIEKWWNWNEPKQLVMLVKIGIGMVFCILCCFIAWIVEVDRLNLVAEYKEDTLPMSNLWLAPLYFCLGIMEGLVDEGLSEFYYHHVDESMKLYESPFNKCVVGLGMLLSAANVVVFKGCWFSDNINRSSLDKYFLFLAWLSSVNLCLYSYVAYGYLWSEPLQLAEKHMNMEVGLADTVPADSTRSLQIRR